MRNAMGSVVGWVFCGDEDANGPILLGASLEEAASCPRQPQVPIVLVQLDANVYKGDASCVDGTPRVVPIAPRPVEVQAGRLRDPPHDGAA